MKRILVAMCDLCYFSCHLPRVKISTTEFAIVTFQFFVTNNKCKYQSNSLLSLLHSFIHSFIQCDSHTGRNNKKKEVVRIWSQWTLSNWENKLIKWLTSLLIITKPSKTSQFSAKFRFSFYLPFHFIWLIFIFLNNVINVFSLQPGYLGKLLPDSAPACPEPLQHVLNGLITLLFVLLFVILSLRWYWTCFRFVVVDVQEKILPGVTHWQSPNYFAYFPSNSSIAGFLGEMLSAGLNIVGFSWISSPAATELETIVLDWLAKALLLPHHFFSTGKELSGFFYEFLWGCKILLEISLDRTLNEFGLYDI